MRAPWAREQVQKYYTARLALQSAIQDFTRFCSAEATHGAGAYTASPQARQVKRRVLRERSPTWAPTWAHISNTPGPPQHDAGRGRYR